MSSRHCRDQKRIDAFAEVMEDHRSFMSIRFARKKRPRSEPIAQWLFSLSLMSAKFAYEVLPSIEAQRDERTAP